MSKRIKPIRAWGVTITNVKGQPELMYAAEPTRQAMIEWFGGPQDWESAKAAGYRMIRIEIRPARKPNDTPP